MRVKAKIIFIICATFTTVNSGFAQEEVFKKSLAFDIGVATRNLVESAKEVVSATFSTKENTKKDRNSCEIYDQTNLNLIDLDLASTKAFERIEKIEYRLETEIDVRAEIFEKNTREPSPTGKKLTDLQKKERIVFREMKKELDEARSFYTKTGEVVVESSEFLESVDCEVLNKKTEQKLEEVNADTEELLTEESVYRQTFFASLKDKMSILQTGVKEAVK